MKIPTKFDELIILSEAGFGTSFNIPTPTGTTAPTNSFLPTVTKALTNLVGQGLKTAITNPSGAASAINSFRQGGAAQGITNTVKSIKNTMNDQKTKAWNDYYTKLDFSKGWPIKGSKFEIAASDGLYLGIVINTQQIADIQTITVTGNLKNKPANTPLNPLRAYVINLNHKERAYFSIQQLIVSDQNSSGKFVKNEKESDNSYVVNYEITTNTPTGAFCLKQNKTYPVMV